MDSGKARVEELINAVEAPSYKHCEDYIRDRTQPMCLRRFLLYKRIPGSRQCRWEEKNWSIPELYATYSEPNGPGGRKGKVRRVRVVMASRFGDVGITRNLDQPHGYYLRLPVSDLTDFSETP